MGVMLGWVGRQVASSPLFGDRPWANHCSPQGAPGRTGPLTDRVGGRTLWAFWSKWATAAAGWLQCWPRSWGPAQLPQTHSGPLCSLGAPTYHMLHRGGEADGEVLCPCCLLEHSWELVCWALWGPGHRRMGFLCCSDFLLGFQQNTSELRTREWLEESMSQLHRAFLFASGGRETEVHTSPRSRSRSSTGREPDLIETLNLLALGSLKHSSLGSGLCAD